MTTNNNIYDELARLERERDALRQEIAGLREALEQVADQDDLSISEYHEKYGVTIYERSQAAIARAVLGESKSKDE